MSDRRQLGEADRRRVLSAVHALRNLWEHEHAAQVAKVVERLIRADAAIVFRAADQRGRVRVFHTLSENARSLGEFKNHELLPQFHRRTLLCRDARRHEGRAVGLDELGSRALQEEFRELMLAPNGIWFQLRSAVYRQDGALLGYAGGFRTRRSPGFTERDFACLNAVVPVLRETFDLVDLMGDRPLAETELAALLDALPTDAFVLASSGVALFANRAAVADHRALPTWAMDAARTGRGNARARVVRIELDGRSVWVVLERRAVVPHLPPHLRAVAELLAAGCSDREIARRLRISHGSARVYVGRVHARLGVYRRTDVARILAR